MGWNRAAVDAYLMSAAVGVLTGVAVTLLRTPLQMPGHKAVFWISAALACRLATKARGGATTSVLGTLAATLLLGGHLGGGSALMMPLVAFGGVTLDVAASWVERHKLSMGHAIFLLALAGIACNLICFLKRLFEPSGRIFNFGDVQGLLSAAVSHAFFGLIAGLCGAVIGFAILRRRSRKPEAGQSVTPGE